MSLATNLFQSIHDIVLPGLHEAAAGLRNGQPVDRKIKSPLLAV